MRRRDVPDQLNALTEDVIGAALEVHRHLGAGYREEHYKAALEIELRIREIPCEREVPIPPRDKGRALGGAMHADFVVHDLVIVEAKAVEALHPQHQAQVISYLAASGRPVGLLINFNAARLAGQIRRFLAPPALRGSVALGGEPGPSGPESAATDPRV